MPQSFLEPIIANLDNIFADDRQWNDFLAQQGIVTSRHVQIATEGALIGSVIEHGLCDHLAIISDDAGQNTNKTLGLRLKRACKPGLTGYLP
jgi:hypothetical protein